MAGQDFGSGEYSPTPSHMLPAFIDGEPTGFTCTTCGHLQKDLDPVWEDICPICLRSWAKLHVPLLIQVKDALEKRKALEPTVTIQKVDQDQVTTKILSVVVPPRSVWSKIRHCIKPPSK